MYTNQEGTKNWIHTNLYQETALCLDSFFSLKVEASTVNLNNYYPSLVPECRCQARLFLADTFAIPYDNSTGGISRLKCTVESDLIYRINNRIIIWDLTHPSAGNFRCLISPEQRPNEHTTYVLFGYLSLNQLPLFARLRPAGGTMYCSHRGIEVTIRSLEKHLAWFHINFSLAHTSAFWRRDWIP